ncbi:NCS1 family transporter [Halomonas dongshanensis]|uniref:NCS1 family transporter n=1 Tax=Halomonas dongshanensis TaxID=2890835 RepID=A0ABT2EDZ5_9GAMM|nr:NCS1 family transporter [Halomonas dongshanensis]MCS2609806.1 NCS1 family transporter [Halomonas dongshanensis]
MNVSPTAPTDEADRAAPSATKALGDESLAPQQTRIMGRGSYFLAWFGGCVSIGTFAMGSSVVGTLNLLQATLAIAIGCFVIGVALAINGAAGYKYGIPFMVQARSAFGFSGTRIPGLVRAVPAVVWYGFQSWIGAGALNMVSATLFGFDSLVFYFIAFQLLQIALSVTGFQGIKWLENIGSAFILCSLVYMFYATVQRYGDELSASLLTMEGSWGMPFWGATMLFLGIYSTMMLNVSDYAREHKQGTSGGLLTTIYAMSILPCTLFMGLIGYMVSQATGTADPIQVFANAVDNTPLLMTTLLFIAFAQVTTNVLNNVVPPTYVLMDVFKLKFTTASVIVGLLAFATFPWKLVQPESAAGLQLFVQTYSAFLGPLFAILVVDYYLIRHRTLDLDKLYDPQGPYQGVNLAALVAMAIGIVAALSFSAVSWYASLIPAGFSYYLLMKHWPACQRFRQ